MKPNTHPDYHDVIMVMTDGTELPTRSTYGKPGDKLRLDVDPKTHPAWNKGGYRIMESVGQIEKFKKRYAAFGIGSTTGANKKEEKKDDKKN